MDNLKFLLLDLELTFAIYYAYPSKREQYLSAGNIIHDQVCTCAAWKWLDESATYVIKTTDNKKRFKENFRDDFEIAVKLHQLMEEADVIVAHNGDNFDIKHANSLFIKHGLGPIPARKSIDTLKVARKYFAFPGNSLDQLSKRFGNKGKNKKPNWHKMTDGDANEVNRAAIYCKNDVRELEKIFLKLRPFMNNYPSIIKNNTKPTCCNKCQSVNITKYGSQLRASGKVRMYRCLDCLARMTGEKI
jgi:DNA polymerase elongation subunit (family B)